MCVLHARCTDARVRMAGRAAAACTAARQTRVTQRRRHPPSFDEADVKPSLTQRSALISPISEQRLSTVAGRVSIREIRRSGLVVNQSDFWMIPARLKLAGMSRCEVVKILE